ncbi:MAG: hypothetical protein NTX65_05360 [Ignavibacteriales bacterium]|nr:hypothetical protein [Ignavibacteriales bacterium]
MPDLEKNNAPDQKQKKPQRSLFRKIINVFIGIFLGLLILSILTVGFTQTRTFRELLREKVIALANKELNGKLNIENIDGTILTSLFLRNTSIVVDNDTLLFAKKIEIKTSPLQLLLKKIFVRNILLEDVNIAMLQNREGQWNFEKLLKPKPVDTTSSTFSFAIQANDIQFHNISFIRQSFSNLKSKKIYPTINMDDLRIENLNFSAHAFADIPSSNYLLALNELSFKPNLSHFNLKYISGEIAVTKEFVSVRNFYLLTDSSEVNISARLDSLNLFGKIQLDDFKNYPFTISAKSKSFNFDDLSSFLTSTEILKGNPSMDLKAHGKFGNFKIDKFIVDFRDIHIKMEGKVQNLNKPEKLFINAKMNETDISYKDILAFLPTLKIPEFAKLKFSAVDMEFEGEPLNFKSRFAGNIDEGKLSLDAAMNLNSKPMTYDINFKTENLDLFPVLNINTKLVSSGKLKGKGFSISDIAADFQINADGSRIDGYNITKFNFSSHAANHLIDLQMDGSSDKLSAFLKGEVSFDKDTIPSYNLVGQLKNVNLANFLKDEKYESNFNFYISADGKSFNPDELNATFKIGIDSSRFQGERISNSDIQCSFKKDSAKREIILTSDFADFTINGSFSLSKAIELVTYESGTISRIISSKISELNPISIVKPAVVDDSISSKLPDFVNENLKFNFNGKFKDLELLTKIIGYDRLDFSGEFNGNVKNESGNFSVSTELNLDYFVMMQKDKTIYLSGFDTQLNFTRDNNFLSFDKLFGTASLTGKRFYSGSNIKSIAADVTFNQSKLYFSASANIADMFNTEAEGIIKMTPGEQQLLVDNLSFDYNKIEWKNKDTIKVLFNPNYFRVSQCRMQRDTSLISLSGIIESSGKQDWLLNATGISGDILERYIFGLKESQLIANGSASATIKGELENPIIELSVDLKNLKLLTTQLGNIKGILNYTGKKLTTNIAFLDSTSDEMKPLFLINGILPIDLSFSSVSERLMHNEPINIQITSSQFNLNSLGRVVPGITDQSGILSADLNITGTINSPVYAGTLSLTDGAFKSRLNNLDYKCAMKLRFEKESMTVDNFVLSNAGGTKYSGTINGYGGIDFDGFKTKEIKLRFNGDLAVLGQQSQIVSPLFYGDLLIGTDGDWLLTKNGDRVFFQGNVLLKNTDLTYTSGQENGGVTNKNFNFIFVEDSSKIDSELARFQQVLLKEKDLQNVKEETEKPLSFDYEIEIRTENSAKAVIILSQAANQELIVEMRGDLKYSNFSGETRAQGSFELLQDSKLEFFKTFDATGLLRFESDITNPYLDIVATYTNDYINPREENSQPQEVAVKIKIRSPLSDLGKSLAGNTESIGVYIGAKNIQNNIRDTRYDYADAFSFILTGKFKDDLTVQDKTNVAGQTIGSTGYSLLGSVLTNYLNSSVGDLVNNIQINQTGYATKFSLSGKIQNLRYSFGGTTEVFQNIGKANLKLDWSPLGPSFLIRIERRDPVVTQFGSEDKVSEFSLKYRFEF